MVMHTPPADLQTLACTPPPADLQTLFYPVLPCFTLFYPVPSRCRSKNLGIEPGTCIATNIALGSEHKYIRLM